MTVGLIDRSAPPLHPRIAPKARLLASLGLPNVRIAEKLGVSHKTVARALKTRWSASCGPRLRLPRGPGALVRNLDRSLKPEAIVAMVECNPDKVGWGTSHGCTSAAGMEQDFVAAGFDITRLGDSLSEDTIYLDRATTGTVRRDPATQGLSGAPRPARRYRLHRSDSS